MEYEEAYYYFAVVQGLKMKNYRVFDFDQVTGWEAFWADSGKGQTEGWDFDFDTPILCEVR
jgi:hypothetical protein